MSSFAPTPGEIALVNAIFAKADPQKLGILTGEVAVDAFNGSKLSASQLGEIWGLSDEENQGFLTRKGVAIAVRLMGWAQKGETLSKALISKPGPIPKIEGIAPAIPQRGGTPASRPPTSTGSTTSGLPPPLTPQDKTKFMRLFAGWEKARDVFLKSKLPVDKLSQIWYLSDTQNRGVLDSTDFTIGMYLIQACMSGPTFLCTYTLPPGLYEQAGGGKGPDSVATHNTGSSGFPSPAMGGAFPGRPVQPQHTGPAQSILQPQYTGQPLQPTHTGASRAAVLGSSAFGTPQPPQAWDVTPQEKANADQFFNTLDPEHRNYIEADAAVPFMLQSQLSEDVLAQVWDLADMNNDGRLTRDGFAVAMHLIQGKLAGKDIPNVLPPSLIPPSMRGNNVFGSSTAPQSPPVHAVPQAIQDLLWDDEPTSSPAMQPMQPQPTGQAASAFSSPNPYPMAARPTSPPQPTPRSADPFASASSFPGPASLDKDLLGDSDDDEPPPPQLQDQSAEIGNTRNQLNSTNRSLDTVKNERQNIEQALAAQAAELSGLQTQLSSAKAAYETETRLLSELRDRFNTQNAEIRKSKEELIRAESDLSALRVEKSEIGGALLRDKDEIRALQRRMNEVGTEVEMIKLETEKSKKEAKQQKGLLAIAKKQLATRETEKAKVEKELAEANAEVQQATKELQEAEAALAKAAEVQQANGHAAFTPGSPDSLALAAAQPLPSTPDVGPQRIASPTGSIKSNNPFERLAMGGTPSRTQSPFLPFANADMPTPVGAPTPAADAPADGPAEDPFGFNDAFGTVEPSPAEKAAAAVEHPQPATPRAPAPLTLDAPRVGADELSPVSAVGTDAFQTPPSTATAATHPFVQDATTPTVPGGFPGSPDRAAPAALEELDLSAPLKEHEVDESDSSDDDDDDVKPSTVDKGKAAVHEPETPTANGQSAPNSTSAFDDSFGIPTPTTATATSASPFGSSVFPPPTSTSLPAPTPALEAKDAFGMPVSPVAPNGTQVSKSPVADVNAFDEAMGSMPSAAPAAAPFSFDTGFEDNFDFGSATADSDIPAVPQPQADAPPKTDGFDNVFGIPPVGSATPSPLPAAPPGAASFSFDDAFGGPSQAARPSLSASEASQSGAPTRGLSFDDAFGMGGSQGQDKFATVSSQGSGAPAPSTMSTKSFSAGSAPGSPVRSSITTSSITTSPPARATSPLPRHSSPKPRPSTASSEKSVDHGPKPKEVQARSSRLSIRLPFGKKKNKHDKHELPPPLPNASQSNISAPIAEEPSTGTPSERDDIEPVKQMCAMGFSRTQAIEALEKFDYDVPRALNSLIGAQ